MKYNIVLADRIRQYLSSYGNLKVDEKEMFRGVTFMVNEKMCVSVSGENLMCRFDPALQEEVAEKDGFEPMIMKGKVLKGYCYVYPSGLKSENNFEYWISLCLNYNDKAKSSKRVKKSS